MTINDKTLYEEVCWQIDWWDKEIKKEDEEETDGDVKRAILSYMKGRRESCKLIKDLIETIRNHEVKMIEREMKNEDNKQAQSA